MSPKDCAYIVERLAIRFMAMVADHERQLAEHRTSFGARTEADAKIIAGLRAEIKQRAKEQDQDHKTIVSLISERDGLRVQVQDMREEIIRVNEAHGRTKVEHDGLLDELAVQRDAFTANVERIRRELCEGRDALRAEVAALQERLRASIARGDFAQMEVAALKSQTPKHPVKVGEWVRRTDAECDGIYFGRGVIAQVLDILDAPENQYTVSRPEWNGYTVPWAMQYCEPCDPPEATHDTEAGKAAAEAALKTEIKVGDVVEVVSNTGLNTWLADVGSFGTVASIETIMDLSVRLAAIPGKKNALGGYVSLSDVRKVTT